MICIPPPESVDYRQTRPDNMSRAGQSEAAEAQPQIFLLTESDGFFGQRLMPWESMDLDAIVAVLSRHFRVSKATYAQVANGELSPSDAIFIHSSSQQPEYKHYVDDVLLYLQATGNLLVPSIHVSRSHENKGYQELHKRLRGVASPRGFYVAKPAEIPPALEYPIVFKEVSGFGSSGVRLVRSGDELLQASAAQSRLTVREAARAVRIVVGNFLRKHLLRRVLPPIGDYYAPMKRFVLQNYIPGLTHDFKVLAFANRMFTLKRDVRANDFRASGSGRFSFEDPPMELLDFAHELLRRFDEPYMSFDICFDGSHYHLIEFQGVHFGPYTLTASQWHFRRSAGGWERCTGKVELEEVVAESLVQHLQRALAQPPFSPSDAS